ncbi:DNA mismatch repair protein [Parvularcula bermudensis HTCC2503]|uniref:DNA mismatch repair protein MutL n=1 Tax=Parvularcula bermudensis (strain ATCC BAA-594 / HTCC2503 / KCTC 12087) TaxID=314260 RepID=E0TDQ8_PARBH|nr:DNA mismatch repair endonuclease MutL [Parvularcula bermudensis]ADM09974.1 DNA mismatch repair protein [Parvularcula bermudensis HTCC2503]
MSATHPHSIDLSGHRPDARLSPRIRRLPAVAVNRIAAGEVIERPAAAVKELVENAIDAGARTITVRIDQGGKALIDVEDDGCGMGAEDLILALERHATSKLAADETGCVDLLDIATLGFRGEALPSIGAVAELDIASRCHGGDGIKISCRAGVIDPPRPHPFVGVGTKVSVKRLFFATPARLKFLKADSAETRAVSETLKALAMAQPEIGFTLIADGRQRFSYPPEGEGPEGALRRLGHIMGKEFEDNALAIDIDREGARLHGFAGVPTLNRGQPDRQYLFVNGRPVKDRLMVGAVRGAYADFLARDRHPLLALYIDLPFQQVDVNVHPAKTEVRFRDAAAIRGMIVSGLRHMLAAAGHRASTTIAASALSRFEGAEAPPPQGPNAPTTFVHGAHRERPILPPRQAPPFAAEGTTLFRGEAPSAQTIEDPSQAHEEEGPSFPLGVPRAQLHETYVLAQTTDGIVIVDQHAAHERLIYEAMKSRQRDRGIERQTLLIPEVVDLPQEEAELLIDRTEELAALGLVVEAFGGTAVLVREVPCLFGDGDVAGLIRDIAADLVTLDGSAALETRLGDIAGNMACRGAIKSGRRLTAEEMNRLLRDMEAVPHSGQCNHGRPTYVELKLADIERLFGRR